MKIEFAPLNVPLHRRIQTAAVVQWVFSFLALGKWLHGRSVLTVRTGEARGSRWVGCCVEVGGGRPQYSRNVERRHVLDDWMCLLEVCLHAYAFCGLNGLFVLPPFLVL